MTVEQCRLQVIAHAELEEAKKELAESRAFVKQLTKEIAECRADLPHRVVTTALERLGKENARLWTENTDLRGMIDGIQELISVHNFAPPK